jgi:hypothetical protein
MEYSLMQSLNIIKQNGTKHNVSSNVIKQDGIKHNASSNVIKQDRINALILFHTQKQNNNYRCVLLLFLNK